MFRGACVLIVVLLSMPAPPCTAAERNAGCDALELDDYAHTRYPWQQANPLDYLTYLKFLPDTSFTVFGCKEKWVKEADIPALLALLDSREACPNQASARSSYRDDKKSTVGNEAAWLIESFRVGRFPPGLNSTRNAPSAAELRRWWQQRRPHG